MRKIKLLSLSFLVIILIIFLFLNIETTRKIAINYKISEYKIPIHLKINDFFNRHYNYKNLVKQINNGQQNKKLIVLNTSNWVNKNIQKTPAGIDIIDHHPLTIVHRRLGAQDQFSDILSVLLIYSNIDSFFKKRFGNITHPLTFFKVNNYWSVLDPYYGVYFINDDENFASVEELKQSNWRIISLDLQKTNLTSIYLGKFKNYKDLKEHYKKLFNNIQSSEEIDNINIFDRGGRSYIQKPINRLNFEIYKLFQRL